MRKYPEHLPYGFEYIERNILRKNAYLSIKTNRDFMKVLCNHLITHPDPMVVPVYAFRMRRHPYSNVFEYSYDMKPLLMLLPEEKRLVNLSFEGFDRYEELPSQSSDARVQRGWAEWPDLMQFMDKWIALRRHRDIHDGNIMIDEEDNYRLVDLEGFIHSPLDSQVNDWITK